jgi:hypothetical protein
MKSRIIEELGQAELMLPNRVARALGANERAKLRMSVLQLPCNMHATLRLRSRISWLNAAARDSMP